YRERAARIGKIGEMTESVRQYDMVVTKASTAIQPITPPFLQGLKIWYKRRSGDRPLVLSLTPDRPLRETEYDAICEEAFLPQLMALLPPTPRRVGDSWDISRQIAMSVWGELPSEADYELTGKLIEVNKAPTGNALTASIGVSGHFTLRNGENAFNARI